MWLRRRIQSRASASHDQRRKTNGSSDTSTGMKFLGALGISSPDTTLQVGHGTPVTLQRQARIPSQGRSLWRMQTQPPSSHREQLIKEITLAVIGSACDDGCEIHHVANLPTKLAHNR